MATDPPSSSSLASASSTAAADSYIGSLISLTSKSEIRYEGVLVVLDTKESTIALQNVRSYGTEDRKKDGPQIPPSEKVYGYILFRGSDIKDLQVKSSPPSLPKSELYNDPIIIQSQSSFEPSSTTSVLGGRTLTVSNSNSGEASLTRPNFSYSLPSYNSTEGSVPAPQHSLSTYQTGYYGGSSSTNNSQQQFPAFQAASLVPPPTLQNQLQNSVASAQLNLSLPANSRNADPMAAPTSVHHSQFVSSNSAEAVPFLSHESHNSSQSSMMAAELFMKSPFVPNQESHFLHDKDPTSFGGPPVSVLPTPSFSQSTSNIVSSSSPLLTASSLLLTPDQLKPSALSSSTQKFFPEMKESAALLPIPPNPQSSIPAMPQAPLLPLPVSSQEQQPSATQFNDEFDFSAMNEKFNKDEVWGSLGKAKQRGGVGDRTQELDRNTEQRASADSTSICDRKPVYNKDDFFDTLSSNSINQEAWNRRSKFSERVKHDTETFGEFQQWPPSGRGNSWGPRPGGNFRGSYNRGRGGYGYYGGLGRRGYSPS